MEGMNMTEVEVKVAHAINRAGIEWLEQQDPKRTTLGWADVPDEVFAKAAIAAYEEAQASLPGIERNE
jgi:hypothetical protein